MAYKIVTDFKKAEGRQGLFIATNGGMKKQVYDLVTLHTSDYMINVDITEHPDEFQAAVGLEIFKDTSSRVVEVWKATGFLLKDEAGEAATQAGRRLAEILMLLAPETQDDPWPTVEE